MLKVEEGTRYPTGVRMDLITPEFLEAMGRIMFVGAQKYGDLNWQKGLSGEKGGVNHAFQHLAAYQAGIPNDYGPREMHLAQVAVNAMFEYHFERDRRIDRETENEKCAFEAEQKKNLATEMANLVSNLSSNDRRKMMKELGYSKK